MPVELPKPMVDNLTFKALFSYLNSLFSSLTLSKSIEPALVPWDCHIDSS